MIVDNSSSIFTLICGIIIGILFIFGGIFVLINYYKKYIKAEGTCVKTWYSLKNKVSNIEYFVSGEKYEMSKHIPFSEEGYKYKLRINPMKPNKALCWYDSFLSFECIFLGILLIVVSFVDILK